MEIILLLYDSINWLAIAIYSEILGVNTVPVNYALRFSGPMTTFTARHVWYGVGMRSICQPDPLTGYKAVVPPPLFHQLSPSFPPPPSF
jgi:hypothetical protein